MPTTYLLIEDFRLGLDRRRSRETGVPGSLWTLVNAHMTRGGEIERMKKPVPAYTLPPGTFGMAPHRLTVFGSAASRAVPEGVTSQRLRHPADLPMAEVLDVEVRSEERRGGKEGGSSGRCLWEPRHKIKKK